MNCKCCGAWFSSSDASQELCAACRRAFARVSPIIESLSTELEQVKQERDGLSIMLTSATSAAETYKRERDAAMKDIPRRCKYCIRKEPSFLADGKMDDVCWTCFKNDHCNWQWRGVKEDPDD